jgi:hypothetical protein
VEYRPSAGDFFVLASTTSSSSSSCSSLVDIGLEREISRAFSVSLW